MPPTPSGVTAEIAAHAAAICARDLPPAVQTKARAAVLDTLACAAAGKRTDRFARLSAALKRAGENGACTSALLLGAAAHVLEYDDAHKRSKTHPGATVVPAVIAAAELAGTSGAPTLASVVAGYEVMLRVGAALGASAHRRAGWHATGTAGTVGAAVGAACALELDADRIAEAIGHAVAQAAGNWAFIGDGAMAKPLQAGNAARAGVLAALAAAEGFRGAAHALEAADGGFYSIFGGDAAAVTRDLAPYLILEVATKPYPCCRTVQSAIDAVLRLRPARDGRAHVRTFAICIEQNGFFAEGDVMRAPFSLPLVIAAALHDGRVDFDTFTPQSLAALRDAERRITWAIDPELDALYPETWAAEVHAGDRQVRVLHALGDPRNPMSIEQMTAKLRICAGSETADVQARVERLFGAEKTPAQLQPLGGPPTWR